MNYTDIPCSYFIWSDFSLFFTSISTFLSVFLGLLTFYIHNYVFKNQQIFYLFTFFSSLFLLIESIDPLSLLGIISPLVIGILTNISTWLSLALFGFLIISLIQVIEFDDLITYRLIFAYIGIALSFILTLTASILQVYYPIWQGIKLIIFACSLIITTLGADYYFYKIIKLFDRIAAENYTVNKQLFLKSYLIIFHILILLIIITQFYLGINIILNPDILLNKDISWENVLLFSLHIFSLIISQIFFLGKFKVEIY